MKKEEEKKNWRLNKSASRHTGPLVNWGFHREKTAETGRKREIPERVSRPSLLNSSVSPLLGLVSSLHFWCDFGVSRPRDSGALFLERRLYLLTLDTHLRACVSDGGRNSAARSRLFSSFLPQFFLFPFFFNFCPPCLPSLYFLYLLFRRSFLP